MTDDEFQGYLFSGTEGIADAVWELDDDHRTQDVPTHTALFTRTFPTYTETMWVHAYANARVIVVSYPGVAIPGDRPMPSLIRTIPVGWRDMASAQTFRAKFELTVRSLADTGGWARKSHATDTAN
jgi:hypothetical protein